MMMDLDDRLLAYERVRAVSAEWSEMLTAIERAALNLAQLGEANHAKALSLDHQHLYRRAHLHLRQVAAQEAALAVGVGSTRPPPIPGVDVIPKVPRPPKLKAL
jgi:hypothetical protein